MARTNLRPDELLNCVKAFVCEEQSWDRYLQGFLAIDHLQPHRGLANHAANPENAGTGQRSAESLADTFLETLTPK